jgi:hypothetical protein
MRKLIDSTRSKADYWLAGAFDRRSNPIVDPALATWSELLGRDQARLWLAARANEGRGR